jgi:DNA-binding response OmpR family regulator
MARKSSDKKRILLVDDERPIRNIVTALLSQNNYTVVEATNGLEALALFKKEQFDLVITDSDMPEMSGDQLVLEIRELDPTQRVILMTANRSSVAAGLANLPDVILDKPFPLETLNTAVSTLLI